MTLQPPASPRAPLGASPSPSFVSSKGAHADDVLGEPMHVALVGMPGAGKTTVGKLVADKLSLQFVDLDEVIADAAGKPVSAIFSEQGETMFRAHERRHVRALLRREHPMVLACGGGTWADAAMRRELLAHTRPVLLDASFDTLLTRLESSNERHLRPLLSGPDPKAALERLWRARHEVHTLCPRQVSSMDKSIEDVAVAVVARLQAAVDAERLAQAHSDLQALSSSVAVAAGQRREQAAGARRSGAKAFVPAKPLRGPAATPAAHKNMAMAANVTNAAAAPTARGAEPAGGDVPTASSLRAEPAREAPLPLAVQAPEAPPAHVAPEPVTAPAERDRREEEKEPREEDVLEAAADTAALPDNHDDAFGTFLQQDIEAFAVPLSSLSEHGQPAGQVPPQAAPASVATPAAETAAPPPAPVASPMTGDEGTTPFLRVGGRLGEYPIYVLDGAQGGSVEESRAAEAVAEQIDAHSHGTRIAIVSDTEVAAKHASALKEALRARGLSVSVHTFAAGEESKRLSTAHGLYDELADAGHGREDTLVALGGGVVTDLTGFVASTYMRGVPLVQVPTSTLAAVDACIGGKTGLNTNRGKNLVGTFFAPQAVVISTAYLRTQSHRAHVAGLVEAAKVAALQDASLLSLMKQNARVLAEGEPTMLREVIGRALAYKARIVERDEQERGERALLNYGHTFGHAIEVGEGFGRLHGEAVALGMLAEAEWAEMHGHATNVSAPLAEVLEALGIPTEWRAARVDLDALGRDKKRMGDTLKLPIVSGLGKAHLTAVALDDLIDFAQATMLPSVRWSR